MSNEAERAAFEQEFPIPENVRWNPDWAGHGRYEPDNALLHPEAEEDAYRQHQRWIGWRTARDQRPQQDDGLQQRSDAWLAVVGLLDELTPSYREHPGTGKESALAAIRELTLFSQQSSVLVEIAIERLRQDAKWGGPLHDDQKNPSDFVQHIEDYAGWARVMAGMGSFDKYRRRMIQVAALAVAAVEATDRALERSSSKPNGEDGQLTECDWCHQKYPDEMLQNETQAGDAICDSCMEKLDQDEEQRNTFGGPA